MSACGPVTDRDFSDIPYPATLPQPLPAWEATLKIAACVLVELVALVGNLLLLAVLVRSPRMRTTINCYIANMAVADLLIALVPMWVHVSNDVISQDGWPLGAFLCKFNVFVQVTAMVASVLTLMAIAGDRFFAIIFPLKARLTERRVGVVVTLVWLLAFSIGSPPLFFYTYHERHWKNYLERFCTDVWPATTTSSGKCDRGLTSKRAYWTLVTVMLNWLPMLVMALAYAIIIHKLSCCRLPGALSMSAVQRRSTRKVVKMLLIVLVTFMACTIPFQVTNLYPLYNNDGAIKLPKWHQPVHYAAVFLMYTNSAVNPLLYGGLNDSFRQGARDLITSLFRRQGARSSVSFPTHLAPARPRHALTSLAIPFKDKTDISLRHFVRSASFLRTTLTPSSSKASSCLNNEAPPMSSESSSDVKFYIRPDDILGRFILPSGTPSRADTLTRAL